MTSCTAFLLVFALQIFTRPIHCFTPTAGSLVVVPQGADVELLCDERASMWMYSRRSPDKYLKKELQPTFLGDPSVKIELNNTITHTAKIKGLLQSNTGDILQCTDHWMSLHTFMFFVYKKAWACSICGNSTGLIITCENELPACMIDLLTFDMQHKTETEHVVRVVDKFISKEGNRALLVHTIAFDGSFKELTTEIVSAFKGWETEYLSESSITYEFLGVDRNGRIKPEMIEFSVGEQCGLLSRFA